MHEQAKPRAATSESTDWPQQLVGQNEVQCFVQGYGGIKADPLSRVAMPHHMEPVSSEIFLHVIEPRESGIELFAEILGEAGTMAGDETVFVAPPFTEDIDGVIELRRTGGRQKARLQRISDKALALDCDGIFIRSG